MKFPGKRKNKHYFPVGGKKRVSMDQTFLDRKDIYITGIEQLLVDIEVEVESAFLERFGIKKGQSIVLSDEQIEEIYSELSTEGKIVGQYPGGAIGNTLHNYSILSDDVSVMLGTICQSMSIGDYAFKYVCNTCSHVDFTRLQPRDGKMARCICFITPDYERSFAIGRGIMDELSEDYIDPDTIKGSGALLITAFLLRDESAPIFASTMKAVKLAKEANVPVILSLGTSFLIDEKKDFFIKFISDYVSVLAMNDQEAEALVGASDPLLACESALDIADMILLTVGAEGLYVAAHTDQSQARATKDTIHSKSISEYNKFEYSRGMKQSECENPIKIYSHINPYMGGPGIKIKNTNGAGDAALSALLHDMASNTFHRAVAPKSPKHQSKFLTYSSLHQIAKYANRVSYEVLKQNSPRLMRGLPEREDSLEESYWEM
ncbi:MAG: inosine/guanosine kinase [Bacteriovoracaceae bacterium]|nr:inosine/guanosine kinase [Bacteriovoracaceae bacterium]